MTNTRKPGTHRPNDPAATACAAAASCGGPGGPDCSSGDGENWGTSVWKL
jgi:hypothetical protein